MKHTPTPWKLDTPMRAVLIGGGLHRIYPIIHLQPEQPQDFGVAICILPREDDTPEERKIVEANARYIVLAVNHHEDLVRALQIVCANASLMPDPKMQGTTDCYGVPLDDIDEARALLAQIEREAQG